MANGNFKDLDRRRFGDELLRDKAFNIETKYDIYQCGLASMV